MVSSGPQPLALNVAPDSRVFAFTAMISILSALVFGSAPALRASRIELSTMLKERRGASSIRKNLLAKALVASQVAFSLVLLVAAVLFVRTLINLHRIDPGFGGDSVLMFEVDSTSTGLEEDSRLVRLYGEIEGRVESIPGVRAASFSMWAFNQGAWTVPARASGTDSAEERLLYNNAIGRRFFEAMETPILAGRAFGAQDTETSPKVAIINEAMAQEFFGEPTPLGKHFRWAGNEAASHGRQATDFEVVGIAKNAKYSDLAEMPPPMAFYPYSQNINHLNFFEVSFTGQAGPLITEVRQAMKEVNRDLQIVEATTMAEQVDRSLTQQTLVAQLSTFFGLVAMLLACIGLFGVMSYTVARRTNEIGIRMALGAQRGDVLRLVMREGLLPVVVGLVIGVVSSLLVGGVAEGLLYNLTPNDPATIVVATLLLAVVAAIAGYLPARKASRLDPMAALRYE
jgi:predicted permease